MRINEDFIDNIESEEMTEDTVSAQEELMTPKEFYMKYAPKSTHMVTVEMFVNSQTLRYMPVVRDRFEKLLDFYYRKHSEIQAVCLMRPENSLYEEEYLKYGIVYEIPDNHHRCPLYEFDDSEFVEPDKEQVILKSCISSLPPNEIKRYLNFSAALYNMCTSEASVKFGTPVVYLSNNVDNFEGVEFSYQESEVSNVPYRLLKGLDRFNHDNQIKILDDLDNKIIGSCVRFEMLKEIQKWYDEQIKFKS